MQVRAATWWHEAQQSLWFLPTLCTVAAVALAIASLGVDRQLSADVRSELYFSFGGGAEGARGVLSTIAGGIMTVTGTLFSITIVALQLASSQFTPRVLRSFTGDRANQIVLGVFISTFTYTLLVLRTIRSGDEGGSFVPSISVAIAIVLALASIGFLIFFIHHIARSIQVSVILDSIARDTRHLVERLFPEPIGDPASQSPPVLPTGPGRAIATEKAGYLQAVDDEALFELANRGSVTLRMEARVGEFILPGATLISVWPPSAATKEATAAVHRAFVLGPERTLQHDVEFGLRQMADIAIKALSPGINDPTTAMNAIDRLAETLVLFARRQAPPRARTGAEGSVVILTRSTDFPRALRLSFDQIRHYGRDDAVVAAHLHETLRRMADLVPPESRPAVHAWLDAGG